MFYSNYKRSLSNLDTVLKPSKWIPHIANKLEINEDLEDKWKTTDKCITYQDQNHFWNDSYIEIYSIAN